MTATKPATEGSLKDVVLRVLGRLAPEADLGALDPLVPLREQLDIDSMDFLNLLIGIDEELGIDIPERDYRRVQTLDGLLGYLADRQGARPDRATSPPTGVERCSPSE